MPSPTIKDNIAKELKDLKHPNERPVCPPRDYAISNEQINLLGHNYYVKFPKNRSDSHAKSGIGAFFVTAKNRFCHSHYSQADELKAYRDASNDVFVKWRFLANVYSSFKNGDGYLPEAIDELFKSAFGISTINKVTVVERSHGGVAVAGLPPIIKKTGAEIADELHKFIERAKNHYHPNNNIQESNMPQEGDPHLLNKNDLDGNIDKEGKLTLFLKPSSYSESRVLEKDENPLPEGEAYSSSKCKI